jgi:hypothetical protein
MCDWELYHYVESLFCCGNQESNLHHKTHSHHKKNQNQIYHRVSLLLPKEEFSFHKMCDNLFPRSEAHIHNTQHAILPIVITKDGHLHQNIKARKI